MEDQGKSECWHAGVMPVEGDEENLGMGPCRNVCFNNSPLLRAFHVSRIF